MSCDHLPAARWGSLNFPEFAAIKQCSPLSYCAIIISSGVIILYSIISIRYDLHLQLTMMRYMNCSFSPIDGARLLLPLDPFSMELPLLLLLAATFPFALPRKPVPPPPPPTPPPPVMPAIRAEVGTFSRRMEMATGPRLSSSPNQFWCSERRKLVKPSSFP